MGASFFLAPWWLPYLTSFFGIALEAFGAVRAETPILYSPEFWGGALVVSGLLIIIVNTIFRELPKSPQPFFSTAIHEKEDFYNFAVRVARRAKLELELRGFTKDDLTVPIFGDKISGPSATEVVREAAGRTSSKLDGIYVVEAKHKMIVGRCRNNA